MKSQTMTWVDVNEELPKHGQRVLCIQDPTTTGTGEPLMAIFDERNNSFLCPEITIYANFETGMGKWVDIIYWMPLPKTVKQLN